MATKTTNRGLGKGFDVLMPQDFDASLLLDEKERIHKLAVTEVKANPDQPRRHFDEEALSQLAASIKRHGILQPLVVTPKGEGYVIIAGERRYRAAQKAGLSHIPALVRTVKELEQLEIALTENVQRVDLSPWEQALSITRLHEQFSLSYEDIAKRLGKASSTIINTARLLGLSKEAQEALQRSVITEGHARAILALREMPDKQAELLEQIQKNGWSVRQAEQFAVASKSGKGGVAANKQRGANTSTESKKLSDYLSTRVSISRGKTGGKLQISFKSDKDLERILKKITE